MSKAHDLANKRFDRLVVIERCGSDKQGKSQFLCKCDCGNTIITLGKYLVSGHTRSCGCLVKDAIRSRCTTHGHSQRAKVERLYKVWLSIKSRVFNPNENAFKHYGGRGISMCEEWRNDYAVFRKWALENGYDPSAPRGKCTIDRINPNGDYCPENCRWVDMHIQNTNKIKRR